MDRSMLLMEMLESLNYEDYWRVLSRTLPTGSATDLRRVINNIHVFLPHPMAPDKSRREMERWT